MRRTTIAFQNETLARLAEEQARTNGLSLSKYIQRLVSQDTGAPEKSDADIMHLHPQERHQTDTHEHHDYLR